MPKDNRRAGAEERSVCEEQVGPEFHESANAPLDPGETQLARRRRQRREQRKRMQRMAKSQHRRDDRSTSTSPSGSASGISPPRARPSDSSFFSSASNTDIEGGHFSVDSSTNQSKTNLTINLLHNPAKDCMNAYAGPFDSMSASTRSEGFSLSSASRFRRPYTWLDYNTPHSFESSSPSARRMFNVLDPKSLHDGGHIDRPNSFSRREEQENLHAPGSSRADSPAENVRNSIPIAQDSNVQSKHVPSSTDPSGRAALKRKDCPVHQDHDSDQVQESSDIYYRHLAVKKRGYPLWLPEPNYYLPMEYQRKGISVGDVGMLTTEGGFDYLFNVLLSHDHPFNLGRVPPDFAPLLPELDSSDIRGQFVFRLNSFTASPGVRRSFGSSGDCGINFYIPGSEGAILMTPDGAVSEDLGNLSRLRQYMSENIESWYRYANGPRGRELANGDLRLVIGCDKTSAWGMAAFAKLPQGEDTVTQLRFNSVCHNEDAPRIKTYGWELHSGTAEVRSGPDVREIQALSAGDADADHAGGPRPYENQCIFVRTVNTTLNTAKWLALMEEIKVPDGTGGHATEQSGSNRRRCSEDSPGARELGGSTEMCIEHNPSTSTDKTPTRHELAEVPVYLVSHPSKLLNEFILRRVAHLDVKMVITDDSDWSSVLTEDEFVMPNLWDLTKRILTSSTPVRDSGGIMYLEKNMGTSSVQQSQPPLQLSELPPVGLNDSPSFNESTTRSVPDSSSLQSPKASVSHHHQGGASVNGGASHGISISNAGDAENVGGGSGQKEGHIMPGRRPTLQPTFDKHKKRILAVRASGKCQSCNTRGTSEWRRGPAGARTLCNACGLRYAILTRKSVGVMPPRVGLKALRGSIQVTDIENGRNKGSSSAASTPSRSGQASVPTPGSPMDTK